MGERTYTSNLTQGEFIGFVQSLKEKGSLRQYHSTTISGTVVTIKQDEPEHYQETKICCFTQSDRSTRIEVVNVAGGDRPFIGWPIIRRELERSGYRIQDMTGSESTVYFGHRYIDPSKITNPNHRLVIERLIAAEQSGRRVRQKDIAEGLQYSESSISRIREMYLRQEPMQESKEVEEI